MRLLIVEDENNARLGMKAMVESIDIPLESCQCAENGERGLMMAKIYKPDVIISDIRMPKLDGIELSREVKRLLPNCQIILISAYSDKAYLKAAVRLHVKNYLEKPVTKEKLEESLLLVFSEYKKLMDIAKNHEYILEKEKELLAEKLSSQMFDLEETQALYKSLGIKRKQTLHIRTVIIQIKADQQDMLYEPWEKIKKYLRDRYEASKVFFISYMKKNSTMVIHLFSYRFITNITVAMIIENLLDKTGVLNEFKANAVIGKSVKGIRETTESYNSAIIMLQHSFYTGYGEVLVYSEEAETSFFGDDFSDLSEHIISLIVNLKHKGILDNLRKLESMIQSRHDLSVIKIKELYCTFIFELHRMSRIKHIHLELPNRPNRPWTEQVEDMNYEELNLYLIDTVDHFFEAYNSGRQEKRLILMIKEYILNNFMNSNLTVKSIAEKMNVTNSHLCTVFKKETGITINQFITQQRIEKAKQLLKESKSIIAEVSLSVGYNDNSYFGRIFKSHVGLTPLEYREKN